MTRAKSPPKASTPTTTTTNETWKPSPHTCGVCDDHTTSPKFKKRCLGVHEFACNAYHESLSMDSSKCKSCAKERQMSADRQKRVDHDRRHLDELQADKFPCAGDIRKAEAKLRASVQEQEEATASTVAHTAARKAAFMKWKECGIGEQKGIKGRKRSRSG